jgi:hypothetical protein
MITSFEDSWERWKREYSKHRNGYNKDIWADINRHPLDMILDNLAQLYLEASANQKTIIREALNSGQIEPWDLALYIRRVGLRLPAEKNEVLVNWAFWAAIISHNYVDPRDITVSLILMAVGAKKAEIRIENHLEAAKSTAIGDSSDFLNHALNQSEASVNITIKMFGPPEWKTMIDKAG